MKFLSSLSIGILLSSVPALVQADNGFTIKPRGRLLIDFAHVDYDLAGLSGNNNDTEVRTARFGVQGTLSSRLKFVAEFDFQNGGDIEFHDPKAKDVKLTFKLADTMFVVVGNQKTPNSLEEQTSGRFTTFLERGSVTDAFRLSRRFGAVFSTHGDHYSLSGGVFGNDVNAVLYDHEGLFSNEWSVAARGTYALVNEKGRKVHFGISARRFNGNAGEHIRVRARPRMHLSQRLVDVKNQGENSTTLGLETAYVQGAFHVEAEWIHENAVHNFHGYFVQAGWFISGETRNYNAKKGSFGRVKPVRPLGQGGFGAWEIATRFDTLNLASASAGKMDTWTAGLNWYPHNHVRVMLNAIHAKAHGAAKFGVGNTDGVQMRLQYDW